MSECNLAAGSDITDREESDNASYADEDGLGEHVCEGLLVGYLSLVNAPQKSPQIDLVRASEDRV